MMNLRDSQILNHKQNLDWNWILISTVLKVTHTRIMEFQDYSPYTITFTLSLFLYFNTFDSPSGANHSKLVL